MEAEQLNLIENTLSDLAKRTEELRRYLDYPGKRDRLEEVVRLTEDPDIWNDPKKAQGTRSRTQGARRCRCRP